LASWLSRNFRPSSPAMRSSKFSQSSSQLHLVCETTVQLAFENFYLISLADTTCHRKTFSKTNSLINFLQILKQVQGSCAENHLQRQGSYISSLPCASHAPKQMALLRYLKGYFALVIGLFGATYGAFVRTWNNKAFYVSSLRYTSYGQKWYVSSRRMPELPVLYHIFFRKSQRQGALCDERYAICGIPCDETHAICGIPCDERYAICGTPCDETYAICGIPFDERYVILCIQCDETWANCVSHHYLVPVTDKILQSRLAAKFTLWND